MEKLAVAVLSICLIAAGLTHIFDNLYFGLLPYHFVPDWINFYWSMLGVIDLLAVYLLTKNRKIGLSIALIIMVSNVAINSYAYYVLESISTSFPLQIQTLFLGFCFGVTPWLWQSSTSEEDTLLS